MLAAEQLGPVPFSVFSPQGSVLAVTATSDNTIIFPYISVVQKANDDSPTNHYELTLMPAGIRSGTANVTIEAKDDSGLEAEATFKVVVIPDLGLFANEVAIAIPQGPAPGQAIEQGEALPFPSVIRVSETSGVVVDDLQVVLDGFTHPFPEDVDILLVSPDDSRAVMLMAHAGFGAVANKLRLTFQDGAPPIPKAGVLVSQIYSPANYAYGTNLPLPAPMGPYSTNLAVFKGVSPNGDWKLYVLDDTFPDGGTLEQGWFLHMKTTLPPILLVARNATAVELRFAGDTNRVYSLQSTVDWINWEEAGTTTVGSDGVAKFEIQMESATKARFYRLGFR